MNLRQSVLSKRKQDSFEASIHNTSLSEIEKFSYLKSLLKGPALEPISGMKMDNANYQQAIEILKKRLVTNNK